MNSWIKIIPSILKKPPHIDVSIPHHLVPEPTQEGFRETIGDPQGQKKDYELTLKDGKRKILSQMQGLNTAGSFSPDGDKLGLTYEGDIWITFTNGDNPIKVADLQDDVGHFRWTSDENNI